jgi:hypothetical protein
VQGRHLLREKGIFCFKVLGALGERLQRQLK